MALLKKGTPFDNGPKGIPWLMHLGDDYLQLPREKWLVLGSTYWASSRRHAYTSMSLSTMGCPDGYANRCRRDGHGGPDMKLTTPPVV
ncbi:hypothetical protein SPBR_01041 [Sporothrix brasiliensis 5110]|uniref:Uncharacterized protein n=1 Tax=Sporothrix brasiliensis 5110 TaxID=1398154 RepID=A0A0C2IT26_9PEZI|nr:uncharacterized protein SPBR_01041 [Sporothrix brasiliensis 5110]KIH90015.1 hypothetical protein SPBR_01041 [Sporothrix brasiliensis 5110]